MKNKYQKLNDELTEQKLEEIMHPKKRLKEIRKKPMTVQFVKKLEDELFSPRPVYKHREKQ